jgi:CheY-like chemotaxis protein
MLCFTICFMGACAGVTGNVLPDDINYFKSQGANEVLPKPVRVEELQQLFTRIIN